MRLGWLVYCLFTAALAPAAAQISHMDLKQWGYSAPARPSWGSVREGPASPRLLSFSSSGDLVVGFVTREGTALASRANPGLMLHALTLSGTSNLVAKQDFATPDWYENGLFVLAEGNLLVRVGDILRLYSPAGHVVAETQIRSRGAQILSLPNRQAFVVNYDVWPPTIEVLDSRTFESLNKCSCSACNWFESVSNRNVLINLPKHGLVAPLNRIEISRICGPLQYAYEWRSDKEPHPLYATLLNDEHFVMAGGYPSLEVFDRGTKQWTDHFDRKHDAIDLHVAVDGIGDRFAVLVKKYVGGSQFLDINGHLVSSRVVVYRSTDGRRLAEVPVQHLPSYVFNFAISPDGKLLAILSDGDLTLASISAP